MKRIGPEEFAYFVDPETEEPHIYNHGVGEDEIEEIFSQTGPVEPARNGAVSRIGCTFEGRFLNIIYRLSADGRKAFIITAYTPSPKTLSAYRRRRRR